MVFGGGEHRAGMVDERLKLSLLAGPKRGLLATGGMSRGEGPQALLAGTPFRVSINRAFKPKRAHEQRPARKKS